jgi:hypothetical protein
MDFMSVDELASLLGICMIIPSSLTVGREEKRSPNFFLKKSLNFNALLK